MNKAFHRSIEGVNSGARETARAAARRSGKSLRGWLNDVICEKAEAEADSYGQGAREEPDDEDRLETVSRRLARSRNRQLRNRDAESGRQGASRREASRREASRNDHDRRGSSFGGSRFRDQREQDHDTRHDRDLDVDAIVDNAVAIFEQRAAESERKTAKALESIADLIESGSQGRSASDEGLSAVLDRLGRIESNIAQQSAASSSRPIRGALARLESRIDRLTQEDRTAEFETALQGLDRRLADIADRLDQDARQREARAASFAGAGRSAGEHGLRQAKTRGRRPLADAIAEIVERQRALDEDCDCAAREAPVRDSGHATPALASEPPFGPRRSGQLEGFDGLQSSIAAISRQLEQARLDASERADQQAAVTRQLEQLRLELEGMSRALGDLAPRTSIAAIETVLRDLADRVETQRDHGVHEKVLAPVEKLTSDLRSIVRELDPSRIIRDLHAEVRTIGAKLDDLKVPGGADSAALADLTRQTREIRDLLAAVASRPFPLEKLEARLSDLTRSIDGLTLSGQAGGAEDVGEMVKAIRSFVATETSGTFEAFGVRLEHLAAKIDQVLAKPGPAKRFDEINERIDHVHKSLAARIDRGASSHKDASQLEHLVTKLAKKIDSALEPKAAHPAFDELGRKIERLEERLQQPKDGVTIAEIDQLLSRPANSKQFHELAELVGQLARKVDNALDPKAGSGALLSLERQIDKLSQRLDHADQNTAALVGVERTIGDLFARMEENRNAAAEAAERAVRRATQDILREAANAEPGSLNGALTRELTDLRKNQDETGKRTHETLAAVHETLGRVVDRLALFEEELTELRNAPPAGDATLADVAAKESGPKTGRAPADQTPRAAHLASDHDVNDFLVEPGAGFRPERGESSVQGGFIAAARRAAQQAAAEVQAEQAQNSRKKVAGGRDASASDARGGVSRAILARKRPLLLGLGALVLLVGAYQIAKVGIDAPPPAAHGGASDAPAPAGEAQPDAPAEAKPTAQAAPQTDPAPIAPTAPAAPTAPIAPAPPPPRMIGPPATAPTSTAPGPNGKSAGEAIDAAPVGAIDKSAPGAASQQRDLIAAIRALAKLGDPAAQYELAARYAEGRDLARDAKSAVQWFEKAANQGLAPAQYRLGSLYEKGVGMERDYAQARKWYQRAAERGNARAMHNLAVLFAEGGDGKPDYASAAGWFRKAAELGVRDSQYNLAILHARGLGVGRSLTQSYLWFAVAASQGDEDAGKKRDEVGARLDSKDLAAAKALVDNFKPRQPEKASNDVAPPPGGWENVKIPIAPNGKSPAKPKVSALQEWRAGEAGFSSPAAGH